MIKKIDRMHAMFGVDPCHKCGECCNFVSRRYMSKILKKCLVFGGPTERVDRFIWG